MGHIHLVRLVLASGVDPLRDRRQCLSHHVTGLIALVHVSEVGCDRCSKASNVDLLVVDGLFNGFHLLGEAGFTIRQQLPS